jgi:hypothetical protein
MGQAGELSQDRERLRLVLKGCASAGGRLATAVAELGRSPLRRTSLFPQALERPVQDD